MDNNTADTDICYNELVDVTWTDLKRAMSRVKKFRKQGYYLIADQNTDGAIYLLDKKTRRKLLVSDVNKTFTVKVMGPRKRLNP